ncbi:hypothetical protein ACF1FC_28865 [Streptomyces sp. NPDC014344]|uniref:hypothetical protein n=1 Tax=Streptomyces sp. NPDC014344 TaxID=3364871 RepID=UPI0036FA343F
MRAAAHASRIAEHPAVPENAPQRFLRVACQALFDRFPSLILGTNERDTPWEHDVAFIRPASLPVAGDGKPSTTVG